MSTDAELIDQARRGKQQAYTQLFQRHYADIRALCIAMLQNQEDAEEVVQDTFVQAYLKLEQLQQPAKFLPWLRSIARNRCTDHLRCSAQTMEPLELAVIQTTNPNPEDEAIRQELVAAIMQAVESLPSRDRDVVKAHIDGLSHAQISDQLGLSAKASISRLHRARKRLAGRVRVWLTGVMGWPEMLLLKKLALQS